MASVLAASFLLAGLGAAGTAAKPRPSLRLSTSDLTRVTGSDFGARERVRVTLLVADARRVASVVADRSGRFAVSFPRVFVDRCSGSLAVFAVGSRGSRAALKLPQRACPPAIP